MQNSEYEIILAQPEKINFKPANLLEEVLQNVRTILTTYKYSVPLDREFGLNAKMLDEPQPRLIALLASEMADALAKFERRAQFREVKFEGDSDGKISPKVKVRLFVKK